MKLPKQSKPVLRNSLNVASGRKEISPSILCDLGCSLIPDPVAATTCKTLCNAGKNIL